MLYTVRPGESEMLRDIPRPQAYITLPGRHMMGAKIGDLCVVINTHTNYSSLATNLPLNNGM